MGQWSALLVSWTLEITKCTKGEDEILGAIAARITPRAKIDDALTEIAPRKELKHRIQAPIPTIDRDEELWVISFDGSARVKRGGGAFSAIVWSLPGWEVVKARSGYLESLTVNEAEYNGLILGPDMLESLDRRCLVVCGDSNLVIRQVREGLERKCRQSSKRRFATTRGIEVQEVPGYQDLVTLNRLDEILIPKTENPVVRVAAETTRAGRARSPAGVMQENLIREIRVDRIKQAQEEVFWVVGMKKYLSGSIADLTQADARSYGKIAADYEIDEQDLLFYFPPRAEIVRRSRPIDEIGKGKPVIRGKSPGNLQATYPFQIIAMDHIPSLPRSHKGNTKLLIWVDLFTGYVIAKASSSRSSQTVAEMIRHDREPGFMSDFFRAFNKILGQRQRATMAYRPQANGTAERMKDWDEYAERLTFAINTAHDRIRGDTPTILGTWMGSEIDIGGYTSVAEKINEFSVKLEITGTGYQIFPVVHVSKLKLVKDFSDRPRVELTLDKVDRLDFDEILLPEDSWVPDVGADEYEVERISDVRSGKKTRFGRIYREFLVHWAGYDEPTWVDEADLNCEAILNAFLRERANRNRFNVMQSHEEM
ncbi:reverse transcriptase [Phytophthora megakarya]|uniref:Reverse transcriptase n=1 Tax=Phytophthora megakarya TaxID=4795 RepID=A0A225VNG6_9STRA|nr:reverse transcriptase [Phytophthora megakarya]